MEFGTSLKNPWNPWGSQFLVIYQFVFVFPLSIVNNNNKLERKMRINNAIKLRAALLIISVFVFLRQIITACLNQLYFLKWNEKSGRVFCGLKPFDKYHLTLNEVYICGYLINIFVITST